VRALEAAIPQYAVLRVGPAPAQHVEHMLRGLRSDRLV
jgi:hypothetical protein